MADLADVETAIVSLISSLVYPNGTSSPSAVIGDNGQAMPVRIFRGWPAPAALDQDLSPDLLHSLRAGKMNISVFSRGAAEHNSTRYAIDYVEINRETATVTSTLDRKTNKVTIAGTFSRPITQYVTILVGPRVVVTYNVGETDTANTIAAGLAAKLVAFGMPATVSGTTITVGSSASIVTLVGVAGTQAAEVRRQKTQVQITLWCPSPLSRDKAAALIEPTLANTPFITLADDTQCRLRYHNTMVIDVPEKILLYRRDLIYDAEYPTIVTDTGYEITSVEDDIQGAETDLGTAPHNVFVTPTAPIGD